MRKCVRTILHAVGMAGICLATSGVMNAANAAPVPPGVITGTSYTRGQAGYITGMPHTWYFRYVTAELQMTACRSDLNITSADASATVSLLSFTEHDFTARVQLVCGGGSGSIQYFVGTTTQGSLVTFPLAPAVGDSLRLSVYYDKAHHRANITVFDMTTNKSVTVRKPTSRDAVYTHASVEVFIDPAKVRTPAGDVRLWMYRDVHVTSQSGVRGTVLGAWGTAKTIATTDGTSSGRVVMDTTCGRTPTTSASGSARPAKPLRSDGQAAVRRPLTLAPAAPTPRTGMGQTETATAHPLTMARPGVPGDHGVAGHGPV